jgi:hypothetical protein
MKHVRWKVSITELYPSMMQQHIRQSKNLEVITTIQIRPQVSSLEIRTGVSTGILDLRRPKKFLHLSTWSNYNIHDIDDIWQNLSEGDCWPQTTVPPDPLVVACQHFVQNPILFSYTKHYRLAGCASISTETGAACKSLQICVLQSSLRKNTYECKAYLTIMANIFKVLT